MPTRPNRRTLTLCVAALFLGGCGGGTAKAGGTPTTKAAQPITRTLNGTVVLHGHAASVVSAEGEGTDCGTQNAIGGSLSNQPIPSPYDSWKQGAQVLVRDQNSTIVGTGELSVGSAGPEPLNTGANLDCTFTFSITSVPTSATFYSVAIGSTAPTTFSKEQVTAASWKIHIDATP